MIQEEQPKKAVELAHEVIKLSRDNLLITLRFLDVALYKFKIIPACDTAGIGMNGQNIFYDYSHVLRHYREEQESIPRAYLHMVFHCIFYHPFSSDILNEDYWNIASDIAVENIILELDIKTVKTKLDSLQQDRVNDLKKKVGLLTAEKLYRYFLDNPLAGSEITEYRDLFERDNHEFWKRDYENGASDAPDNKVKSSNHEELLDEWKKISSRIKTDIETFSKEQGTKSGSLVQNIRAANRDSYDYGEFLKRFAVLGEDMQINDEEFDYIFYTYGFKLYKKMPLIEPLEYKEVHKIKDFVIAIDTSGSCSGELVHAFLNKTYSIMKSTESFFRKVNIHIIQCDAEIQSDNKITCDEEFEDFIKNSKLTGFGGTDFRPVFHYVDDLLRRGEFDNLKGLIYFTDGYGTFPEWMPEYDVAFVFIEDEYEQPRIPPWAMKLVLQEEDIIH